jgi:hypothetical protein
LEDVNPQRNPQIQIFPTPRLIPPGKSPKQDAKETFKTLGRALRTWCSCHARTCYFGQLNQRMQSLWLVCTSGHGKRPTGRSFRMTTSINFVPKIEQKPMISRALTLWNSLQRVRKLSKFFWLKTAPAMSG